MEGEVGDDAGLGVGCYEVGIAEGDSLAELAAFELADGGEAFVQVDGF